MRRCASPKSRAWSWSRSIHAPLRRSARSWTSASSSTRRRRRRRLRAGTNRRSCSRRSSSARRPTSTTSTSRSKHIRTFLAEGNKCKLVDRLPRPRNRSPRDRAGDARPRRQDGGRHRDGRTAAHDGRPPHGDDHRPARRRHPSARWAGPLAAGVRPARRAAPDRAHLAAGAGRRRRWPAPLAGGGCRSAGGRRRSAAGSGAAARGARAAAPPTAYDLHARRPSRGCQGGYALAAPTTMMQAICGPAAARSLLVGLVALAAMAASRRDGCVGWLPTRRLRRRRRRRCVPPSACTAVRYACPEPTLRNAARIATGAHHRRIPRRRGAKDDIVLENDAGARGAGRARASVRAWRRAAVRSSTSRRRPGSDSSGDQIERDLPGRGPAARATRSTTTTPSPTSGTAIRGARTSPSCSAATSEAEGGSRSSPATSCAPASRACACAPISTTAPRDPNTLYLTDAFFWGDNAAAAVRSRPGARFPRARSWTCATSTRPGASGRSWRRARRRRPTSSVRGRSLRSHRGAGFNNPTLTAVGRPAVDDAARRRHPLRALHHRGAGPGPGAGAVGEALRVRADGSRRAGAGDGHGPGRRGGTPIDGSGRAGRRRCCSTSRRSGPIPTTRRAASRGRRWCRTATGASTVGAARRTAATACSPTRSGCRRGAADVVRRRARRRWRTSATSRLPASAHLTAHGHDARRGQPAAGPDDLRRAGARPGRAPRRDATPPASTACSRAAIPMLGPPHGGSPACNRALTANGQLRSADPARALLRLRDPRAVRDASTAPRSRSAPGGEAAMLAAGRAVAARLLPAGVAVGRLPRPRRRQLRLVDPRQDRVVSFLAAGVDVIVATDHDVVTNYADTLGGAAAGGSTVIPGVEQTPNIPWFAVPGEDFPTDAGALQLLAAAAATRRCRATARPGTSCASPAR